MRKFVSIICPIRNEKSFIQSCIDTLLSQDYPKDKMEIILVDGMSNDGTREIIKDNIEQYPQIKLIDNPRKIVPHALNLGIRAAQGEIIMRVDAHSKYPTDYVSKLGSKLIELDAGNVGGGLHILPGSKKTISEAIAMAVSHPFGVGNASYRLLRKGIHAVDTVPFGCFKREIFDELGYFDEELVRNQDFHFNSKIIQSGKKIYLIADIVVEYVARKDLKHLFKMYYQYGLYNPLMNRKLKRPAAIRQFVPLFFVLYLLGGLLLAAFIPALMPFYLLILGLYVCLSFASAIAIAIKARKFVHLILLPIVFFTMHISYGIGFLTGWLYGLFNKPLMVNISR